MRIYRSFLFAAAAVGFIASTAFHAAADAVSAGYRVVRAAVAATGEFLLKLLVGPQPVDQGSDPRVAARSKAAFREFQAKIIKRERPKVESSWRMCPSC